MSEARPDIQVVTSENLAEFAEKKLDLAPAPAPAEASETDEPAVEPTSGAETTEATDAATEAEGQEPKKDKLQKRFSELTKQREEAKAEAKAEREAREAAERTAAELKAKYEPPKADVLGPEPTPDQFSDVAEYSKAIKDWTKEAVEHERKQQERVKAWQDRLAAFQAEAPDYQEKIASSKAMISDAVRDAIVESEVGPKVLYHLATNPDVATKLANLSTASALRELGRIEAKLEAQPKAEPKTPAPEISRAPAPITPLKGASAPVEVQRNAEGAFVGTYEQWKAQRTAGKIK